MAKQVIENPIYFSFSIYSNLLILSQSFSEYSILQTPLKALEIPELNEEDMPMI
jgi:hypothetical protein